jgi:integrase
MVDRGAPVGANKTLEVVRRIYSWAVEKELIADNPVTGIKKVAPAGERNRFLTSDEMARYWRQLEARTEDSPIAASILKIMLLTGQRRGEVARMQWSDLDLTDGWWNAPAERTKTRRPYRIPITPGVQRAIDTMGGGDDIWVFAGKSDEGNVGSNVVTELSRQICAKEKIKDFVPHDCRHTVATHLASMGIAEEVIARVLHHAAPHGQTAKYNEHRYDAEKRRTVEAWEAKIDEMLGRQGQSNVVAMGA